MLLIRERRSVSYAIILGMWGLTFLYCLLHDPYLVRIAPEHFAVYHKPLWGIGYFVWLRSWRSSGCPSSNHPRANRTRA